MPNILIAGTDGVVPIYQPEARWCIWGLHEIFTGEVGAGKYIPKVNDYVIDYATFTTYIVDTLDLVTLIPTMRAINPINASNSFTENDILFGVGPGTQADTYRIYIDKSVTPYILAVDSRLKVAGTMTNYAKIFKGSMLTDDNIVSKIYDNSGNYISHNVPLELVAIDSHVNYSIKTVSVCNTTDNLLDGEVLTVVFYSDNGHVVSKRQLLVENTSFIRSLNASKKYVSSIHLETPFMSATIADRIDFPLNVPLNALNLIGVVSYSDGSIMRLPVDGSKFRILGLDQFVSTIVGQSINLVLSYALSANETAYAGVTSDNHYITEPYSMLTINPNNSYAVKLFGYPVWMDSVTGYSMTWWLFNLDRNIFFEVTPYVSFASNTGAYDPTKYGYLQRKSVSINLKDVSGAFKSFIHSQLVDIVLNGIPSASETAWTVTTDATGGKLAYGNNIFAKKLSNQLINISSNIVSYNEWKEKVYLNTYPLINGISENAPPEPTHFIVKYGSNSIEQPIANWNADINIGIDIPLYKNVTVRFIKRTSTGDMQLSISALIVKV